MPMPRPEQRNPAAPELLGSMGAGGAERFGRQSDNYQEDTSRAGFVQSFPARWVAHHLGLPPRRIALIDPGRAGGRAGGAG
jgi:hypothetical protein